MAYNLAQKVSGAAKSVITNMDGAIVGIQTLSLCNIHASDSVSVDLYIASQVGTDITATDVVSAEAEAVSTSSVTLTVDNGSGSASDAADDELKDERIYKSDGTLFGTCTTVSSTTALVFSGGLSSAIANNDVLYVGKRYYIAKGIVIPVNNTLVLERNELRFDPYVYKMYIKLNASDSAVDVIIRK